MPRVNRRSKSRVAKYDEFDIELLLGGSHGVPCQLEAAYQRVDVDSLRVAWTELRDTLLPEWTREHPGTRPYAWWRFDSPSRRERIDGIVHPFDDRCRKARLAKLPATCWARQHANDLYFGVPRLVQTADEASAQYESEAAYLHRHGLLTDAERAELFP